MSSQLFGSEYHKIHTVFKRDERGVIIPDEFSRPEFEYLAETPWRWTEKVDGTNIRVHFYQDESTGFWQSTIGGRTDNAQIPSQLLSALEPIGAVEPFLRVFSDERETGAAQTATPVTLYGEGYGAKIGKGGGNYRLDQGFVLFDVKVGRWWLKREDVLEVAAGLGLETVPVLGCWTLREAVMRVWRAAGGAVGPDALSSRWEGVRIEGVVGVPMVDLFDRAGNRIVAKLKLKDFS